MSSVLHETDAGSCTCFLLPVSVKLLCQHEAPGEQSRAWPARVWALTGLPGAGLCWTRASQHMLHCGPHTRAWGLPCSLASQTPEPTH